MSISPTKSPRPIWTNLVVFLGYLILVLVMTWPLLTRLSTELAGEGTDIWIHQWTFWWIKQALLNGQNPFYTALLYHPNGVSLTSHNIAWFNIALWLPLQALFGPVTAYNLVFILVLALNGFSFYLFAKAETAAMVAAIVGGIIFGFWPYTFSHYDHPNMMTTFWVPMTLYFILRTYRRQRIIDAALTAISLAMIGISRWQLLVMSAPLLLAYALYLFWREPEQRSIRSIGLLFSAALLSALLMAPLAAPLVLDQFGRSGPEAVSVDETESGTTDLLSYVAPPDLYCKIWNRLMDPSQWDAYERIEAGARYIPYVGLAALALAAYGLWRRWSQTWFWLLLAIGIILLALGPDLVVNGQHFHQVPMPYRALSGSLLDTLIRSPHRLNIFLGLPVAMMATWGMADLFSRLNDHQGHGRSRLWVAITAGILGLVILWDNPIPQLPTTKTTIPQWYRDLAEVEEPFAILEIPFHNRGFDKLYMYYQTVHGKPIMVGHVSRLPQEAFVFINSIPFLEPLNSEYKWEVFDDSWVDFEQTDVTRQLRMLSDAGVRYIVLNKSLIDDGYLVRWQDWATFDPIYEDDEVLVYRTKPEAGKDIDDATHLTDDIGVLRSTIAPLKANQEGVLKADIRWMSNAEPTEDYQVCFLLRDDRDDLLDTTCEELVANWPTSDWQANEVARGHYVLPITQDVAPGTYHVDVALARRGDSDITGNVLRGDEIEVVPFAPQQAVSLCWDGGLCLIGYDLNQDRGQLDLALYWQASVTPDRSYKRFVHLINSENDRVLAQEDAIPRNWTYPTNAWEPGEIVIDHVSLPIEEPPPSSYELQIGWYAVDNGDQLAACRENDCSGDTAVYHVLEEFSTTEP